MIVPHNTRTGAGHGKIDKCSSLQQMPSMNILTYQSPVEQVGTSGKI